MPKMPKIEAPKTIDEIVLPTTANSDGSYTCCYCDVAVKRKYDLKRHVVGNHINARPYRCAREGAGCTFSGANQKGNLTQHYNNSPECNLAKLHKEAEDVALKQISPPVKAEAVSGQLHLQFEHPASHFAPTTDEHEIPASILASVTKPKTTSRLGTRRATPYSTSRRRGQSASEARPTRRQAQVVSDISTFNFQLVVPLTQPQRLLAYPVQQYQCPTFESYSQAVETGAWQSGWCLDSLPQSSHSVASQDFVLPQTPEEFSSTVDPTLLTPQDSFVAFDYTNSSFPTTPSLFEDEALQTLSPATCASGGIEHHVQVGPALYESNIFVVETTLPQWDHLDSAHLDFGTDYERYYQDWKTGDQSWLQLLASEDSTPELEFDWASSLDNHAQFSLTAGYMQNSLSRCSSPISGLF